MEKRLTQLFISPERWYRLEYPRIWEVEVVDNIPAFFDPFAGKGALQIFCTNLAGKSDEKLLEEHPFLGGKTLKDKMQIFLHIQGAKPSEGSLQEYKKGKTSFIPFEFKREDRFYMSVLMQHETILLLALYNSEGDPAAEEAKIIGEIIQSIEIPA